MLLDEISDSFVKAASPREEEKESKERRRVKVRQRGGFSARSARGAEKARKEEKAAAQLLRQTLPKKRSKKRR